VSRGDNKHLTAETKSEEFVIVDVSQKELDLAKTLTTALAMEDFDLSEYRDNYADNLRKLVEAKIEGREIVTPTETGKADRSIRTCE
jgi:non-homologous end joining protein Ku